ncbi:MAG: hypothetical protein K0R05_1964 [Anaerocolumna sp.]|nr:hypothetical protein [Anaerocolumna sp.]
MQKIVPHLWFDKDAVMAAKWYVSLFENSEIIHIGELHDTPSGDVETVDFKLADVTFSAISAGPYFSLNPSISLIVACETAEEVDRLYSQLSEGASELMPLGEYPFSKHYVWLSDKYGVNWQLFLVEDITEHQRIRPCLLFAADVCGKAETALNEYLTIFPGSSAGYINRYGKGELEDKRPVINYGELNLPGLQFILMDHGSGGVENFNEAFSFMINCDTQEEIDYYWDKLSHVPEAEACGWVKDKYGVSWQIVPTVMNEILRNSTKEEADRITKSFLKMTKLDIKKIEQAKLGIED